MALINVPKTQLVKVVYCTGMGSSPIGSTTQVDGRLLLLHGDGNIEYGPPQPLCLNTSVLEKQPVAVTTDVHFSAAITTKGPNYAYPLLAWNTVTASGEIMQLAPIPLYFVYDGFEGDLDVVLVLERVMSASSTIANMLTHLIFCCVPVSHHITQVTTNHIC